MCVHDFVIIPKYSHSGIRCVTVSVPLKISRPGMKEKTYESMSIFFHFAAPGKKKKKKSWNFQDIKIKCNRILRINKGEMWRTILKYNSVRC